MGASRVVFNFDNKYVNTKGVSDRVRRASIDYYIRQLQPGGDWAEYHNIVLSVRSLGRSAPLLEQRYPAGNVLRRNQFAGRFEAYDASPIPWRYIMAYIRHGRRSPVAGGLRSAAMPGRDDDDFVVRHPTR